MDDLAIVIVTHIRTHEAERTIRSTCQNLKYDGNVYWYIGDNNSNYSHVQALIGAVADEGMPLLGVHSEVCAPNPYHCGISWNIALTSAHQKSNIVLWLEDDWELQKEFDITPYVQLLIDREDVGAVRLGTLAVGSDMRVMGHNGIHYFEMLKNTQYAYSGNPHLRHSRFVKSYGWFAVDKNPGDIEIDLDHRFRTQGGPAIWRPSGINPWGVFSHIGKDKSYS